MESPALYESTVPVLAASVSQVCYEHSVAAVNGYLVKFWLRPSVMASQVIVTGISHEQ
jgi:hypothetical protein